MTDVRHAILQTKNSAMAANGQQRTIATRVLHQILTVLILVQRTSAIQCLNSGAAMEGGTQRITASIAAGQIITAEMIVQMAAAMRAITFIVLIMRGKLHLLHIAASVETAPAVEAALKIHVMQNRTNGAIMGYGKAMSIVKLAAQSIKIVQLVALAAHAI